MRSVIAAFSYILKSAKPDENPREDIHQDMTVRGYLPETTEILLDTAAATKKDVHKLARVLAHNGIRTNQSVNGLISTALIVDNPRHIEAWLLANEHKDASAIKKAKDDLKNDGIVNIKDIDKILDDIRSTKGKAQRLQKNKRNHAPSPHRSLDTTVLPTEEELDLQEEAGTGEPEEEELDLLAVGE